MLVAADVAKGEAADSARWNSLQIQRPSTATEYVHIITTCSDEANRPLRDKHLVFVHPRSDKDLILFPCLIQSRAWTNVRGRVSGIHNKRPASIWIRWRDIQGFWSILVLRVWFRIH